MSEATIICLDNSDWTRNGDYYPSRWISQVEVYNLLADIKRQQNMENTIGALLMSGKRPDLLLPPSTLVDKIIDVVKAASISKYSEIQLCNSLMIASMALKYRPNKNQKQKILAFIASPVSEADIKSFPEIAKVLKKNAVGLDVVNMIEQNRPILASLVDQVNVSGNSTIISCNSGSALTDFVLSSPIAQGGQAQNSAYEGASNAQDDPELAEALRISLEESKKKEEKPKEETKKPKEEAKEEPMIEELSEEEMLKKAMEMSMQISQPEKEEAVAMEQNETDKLLQDPEFLQETIKKIAGTSLTKEEVMSAIEKKEDKKDEKKKEEQKQTEEDKKKDEPKKYND